MLPEPLKSRYRVDVIDFRHCMDGKYKFVLVCEHDVTKFVTLKALESEEVDEVASALLDIFLVFGAPCILQSQKGRDFCKKLIEELEILWPDVRMVDGKMTNTDVQDNEEPAFRGIPKMLTKWMEIQNCTSWSSVLKFIQYSRNSTFCPLIGKTPHEAMFGCTASVGLGTYLPEDAVHDIFSEEDFENVLSKRSVTATEQRCQIVIQTDNQNTLATFYVDAPLFVNQDTLSVNENFLSFNENLVSVNENILSVNENTISVNDNPISVNNNSLPMSENILSVNENILAVNENTLLVNENTLPVNENTLPVNENTLPINQNTLPLNENTLPLNENTLQVNEIPLQVNEIGPVEQPLPNENSMQLSGIQDKWGELLMEAGISEDQSWDKEYDVDLMDISAIIKDENPAHENRLPSSTENDVQFLPQFEPGKEMPLEEYLNTDELVGNITHFLFHVCEKCNNTFCSREELDVHTCVKYKLFKCGVCEKGFQYQYMLKRHIECIHSLSLECPICSKTFSRKTILNNHLAMHMGHTPFQCWICHKVFAQNVHLTSHLRTHTGEKPFECMVCQKQFAHRASLKNHLIVHSGERPFECPTCKKRFSQRTSLRYHVSTHLGTKPFACTICKKSFSEKSSLAKHLRRKHKFI